MNYHDDKKSLDLIFEIYLKDMMCVEKHNLSKITN